MYVVVRIFLNSVKSVWEINFTLFIKNSKNNRVEEVIPYLLKQNDTFRGIKQVCCWKDKVFFKESLTLLINALVDEEFTSIIGTEKFDQNAVWHL